MAKTSVRVTLNRAALSAFQLAIAEGLEELAQGILADSQTRVPVGAGEGHGGKHLRDTGDWAVFNGSRKVGGTASKPRSLRTRKDQITMLVGYGSPLAHLVERGTAERVTKAGRETGRGPAQPFLLPAVVSTVHELGPDIAARMRAKGLERPSR